MQTKKVLSEGILLLLLPAYFFLICYVVELGYCSYFSIPTALIVIDARNFATVGMGLLLIVIFIMGVDVVLSSIFHSLTRDYKSEARKYGQIKNMYMLLASLLLLAASILFEKRFKYTWIVCIVFILFVLVLTLIDHVKRNTPPRVDPIETDKNEAEDIEQQNRISIIVNSLGVPIARLIFFTFFVVIGAFSYGTYSAENQKTFFYVTGHENIAGITIYGEKIIGAEIENGKLIDRLTVIEISNGIVFEKKEIPTF